MALFGANPFSSPAVMAPKPPAWAVPNATQPAPAAPATPQPVAHSTWTKGWGQGGQGLAGGVLQNPFHVNPTQAPMPQGLGGPAPAAPPAASQSYTFRPDPTPSITSDPQPPAAPIKLSDSAWASQPSQLDPNTGAPMGGAMLSGNQAPPAPFTGYGVPAGLPTSWSPTQNYSTDTSAFNTQYATPDNVNQYANPFLQTIMNRGSMALQNWNPQSGTTANLSPFGLSGYNPSYTQASRQSATTGNLGDYGLNGYNPSYTQANRQGATTNNLGAYGVNGYTPQIGPQVDRQAATMGNLNAYADPSYQFRLQQGINGLDASAAAKGGLLSSGHMKDLEDYSQGLASTEYQNMYNRFTNDQNNIQSDQNTRNNFAANQTQDMFNRQVTDQGNQVGDANTANNFAAGQTQDMFNRQVTDQGNHVADANTANNFAGSQLSDMYGRASGDRSFGQNAYQYDTTNAVGANNTATNNFTNDRNYMTDQYWKGRSADTADNQYNNNFNWDQFKYGDAANKGLLNDYYNQNQGIVNTGINGSNQSGQIQTDTANAIAQLFGASGNVDAAKIQQMSSQQRGLIGSILGAILG